MRSVSYAAASALVAVLLAGCGVGPFGSDEPDVEIEGAWMLESGRTSDGDLTPPPSGDVTLIFDGDVGRGAAGCNDYGGEYDLSGGDLEFSDLAQTLMGCDEPAASFERDYLAALDAVDHVERDGDRLRLTGDDVSLEFLPLPGR